MSIFTKDKLFLGTFSTAGIISADKFNIFGEFKKIKNNNKHYHDTFLPDKEWQESLKERETIKPNDIIKGCKFNIEELKSEIKKNNLYFKDDLPKNKKYNKKNMNRTHGIRNYSNSSMKNNIKNVKNPIISRKYKYHDLHMKKIAKYKKEGLYDKILNQQESIYYPKLDFIYKKIETGPKWEKLSSRGLLFEQDIKKYNTIDHSSYDNKERKKLKDKKNRNIKSSKNNIPDLIKNKKNSKKIRNKLDSAKYSNVMTKSTSSHSKINFINRHNYNNNYLPSTSDINVNINNHAFLNINQIKNKNESEKKIILRNPNRTLSLNNINKCKSVMEFGKYMDYEKLEKKIKKNHQMFRIRDILNPNYTYIQGEVKSFVKYKQKTSNKKEKNKKIIFEGINSNELLYDASHTFDKIYGNKMKAVPIFRKMISRQNDINLPSYMKGLYSRIGLHLTSEKTLQMNNYENAKMYKFEGDFSPKNNKNNSVRKVYYENEINDDKNKIEKDLETMKKKFKNIQFQIYE